MEFLRLKVDVLDLKDNRIREVCLYVNVGVVFFNVYMSNCIRIIIKILFYFDFL